jgi:cytochrome b6-f complex iron-sulfur subunit
MDRREFITWIGVGGLATSLPVAIAACSPQETPSAPSPSAGAPVDGEVVGTLNQLDTNQELLNTSASVGPVLVIRSPDNPDTLIAVNPTCPHAGCTVAWQGDQTRFVCPCHNSQFNADGSLAQGPAKAPLSIYNVQVKDNNILVTDS